jgi:glycosyltransferase involved in cell wall biosynthesis
MSVILFYSPFDQRSRDTESLMIAFKNEGHRVMSLSQASGAQIHDHLAKYDIETYTHIIPGERNWQYIYRHLRFLVSFIKKHKVQVVYSHLESANVVASIAQYLTKAKVYIVRHHINEAKLQGFDRSWTYRLTYWLAKKIIVVSAQAKRFMIEEEKIDPKKIIHINLAYDFSIYNKPDPEKVKSIKSGFDGVTLLTVCRFTPFKRADVAIQTLKFLRDKNVRARLILLGRGEEDGKIKTMIREANLADFVIMPGYVSNVLDYMAAADFLVHPSVLESSCVSVKEAALVGLPVLVCKGVGDFDDYLEHEKNGFAVDPADFERQASDVIERYQNTNMAAMTELLYKRVLDLFDIKNVVGQYQKLNEA